MCKYYLGIDQGTTGTTALLLDQNWNQISRGYREHTQIYPNSGWVEHDAMEIWQCVLDSVKEAMEKAKLSAEQVNQIACIGLANQGETVVLWDKATGLPLCNAIVWQDRRTADEAEKLQRQYGALILDRTGLKPDAYFSATKIQWLLNHIPGIEEKIQREEVCAGTLDAWFLWKLTGGNVFATDPSTASRTMMFNIHTGQWDRELLEIYGIPESILPKICDSACLYGYTAPSEFFGASIPISGSAVDQQAALFGQGCIKKGMVKATYGTGCFMLMNTGEKPVYSKGGLLTTVGWGLDNGKLTFALDAGIYIAGAAIQWMRDKLKIITNAAQTAEMAQRVQDTGGVYFVPAFSGLAAPYWDPYARGTIVGITGGTEQEHIVRAALESIAYQVKDNLELMEQDSGIPIRVLRVDGGISNNAFLMQFQADILGIPVEVPVINETTALGAIYLAAYGVGELENLQEIPEKWQLKKRYEPNMDETTRKHLLDGWHRAVERARDWV